MDLRIISNSEEAVCEPLYGELVLQTVNDTHKFKEYGGKKYFIFNIGLNERYEILPTVRKYDFIKIINCDTFSKYLYFCSAKEIKHSQKFFINIIRYSVVTGNSKEIFTLEEDMDVLNKQKRIKIFALDESYILIQNEYQKEDEFGNSLGFMDIDISIADITTGKKRLISDKSLLKSGIDTIIPLIGNACLLKTGYSLIVDKRFDLIKESERPVEKLCMININQFISDLLLNKEQIYSEPIEKFEKNCTFPYIKKYHKHIIYSKVDMHTHIETLVVMTLEDKKIRTFTNKEVYRSHDLLNPCIINNDVYFITFKNGVYIFDDPDNAANNSKLENCKLKAIENSLVIVERNVPKTFLKKEHKCVEIYKNLSDDPIIHEKGSFVGAVSTNHDNLFIFTKG